MKLSIYGIAFLAKILQLISLIVLALLITFCYTTGHYYAGAALSVLFLDLTGLLKLGFNHVTL